MQWRMRLSEQLYRSTDKAFGFKNKLVYVVLVMVFRVDTLRILHECSCFIEFVKRVGEKR